MPQDIIAWSKGQALVATGIPILPFDYEGTTFHIGQGNNSLLYPGLGLGTIVFRAPPACMECCGGVLLSHTLPGAVPSALAGLASRFGMEAGRFPAAMTTTSGSTSIHLLPQCCRPL